MALSLQSPNNMALYSAMLLVSEHYGCNTSGTTIFWGKTIGRIRLDARIRTIVVLTGGKLTGIP
jgi:hypothetical protein